MPGWPLTDCVAKDIISNFRSSCLYFPVPGLWVCSTIPGLWGTGDGNQDVVHAKQALHQLNNTPNPFPHFRDEEIELSLGVIQSIKLSPSLLATGLACLPLIRCPGRG